MCGLRPHEGSGTPCFFYTEICTGSVGTSRFNIGDEIYFLQRLT